MSTADDTAIEAVIVPPDGGSEAGSVPQSPHPPPVPTPAEVPAADVLQPAAAEEPSRLGAIWGSIKSTASNIKESVNEKGIKETFKEKAAAASEVDWRASASGLGKKIGGFIGGSDKEATPPGDPDPAPPPPPSDGSQVPAQEGEPSPGAGWKDWAQGVATSAVGVASSAVSAVAEDPRGAASAAVGKVKEVGGSAITAVSERASQSETITSVVEKVKPLGSKALDVGSSVVEKTKHVTHIGLEAGRGVAGKAAEAYPGAKDAVISGTTKAVGAARTNTPALVATAGGAIGAGLGAIGNTVGAAAGAAAGVAAAHVAHMRMRRAMKDAGVEGVEVIRLSEALESSGSTGSMSQLESSSVTSVDALRKARAELSEGDRIAVEGQTLYLHQLFDDACSVPAPPSHPPPPARPTPPKLPPTAALAYGGFADAAGRRGADATSKLEAFKRRAAALKTQVAAAADAKKATSDDIDPSEVARLRQMGIYSARSLIAAACTCVSELAAGSVDALGEVGGLGLRAIVALDMEFVKERELAMWRASPLSSAPPPDVSDDDTPAMSAGATACALGSALMTEVGVLVGTILLASRECHQIASDIANLLPQEELKQPLAALNETLDAFEAGLAVDASEVRAQSTEALRHLLPICSLLQPTQDIGTDGAPSAPAPSANTSSAAPATVDAELEALKAKAADAVKLAASAADPPADAAESTADEVAAKLADVDVQ